MRRNRKLLLLGLSTAAVTVAAAATAYACVQTIGQLSVTGPSPSGTSTAIGNGHHPDVGNAEYCEPPTPGATAPIGNPRPDVTVVFGPSSKCNPTDAGAIQPGIANTPADGVYTVNYCNGKVFHDTGGGLVNSAGGQHGSCFSSGSVGARGVLMGTLTVTGGSGSATLKIPAGATPNGPNAYAGVSVREQVDTHPGPPYVNMAPIRMVVL